MLEVENNTFDNSTTLEMPNVMYKICPWTLSNFKIPVVELNEDGTEKEDKEKAKIAAINATSPVLNIIKVNEEYVMVVMSNLFGQGELRLVKVNQPGTSR